MPRGRKSAAKSAKTTKSATKKSEKPTRKLGIPKETPETLTQANSKTKTSNPIVAKTYQELADALSAHEEKLMLGDNIIIQQNLLINHDVEIDFNGFSIIAEESFVQARVLDIRSGIVKLTGHGKIFAMGQNSVAVRVFGAISSGVPNYTNLTIDQNISLYAPNAYGILLSPNLGVAYGLTVNFAGKIMAHDGICLSGGVHGYGQHLPTINIEQGAAIIAEDANGIALEASGNGQWKIDAARLSGAIGVILRTGTLEFSNTQISAVGDTFYIDEGNEKELTVKANGGIYLSRTATVINGTSRPVKKFTLQNCELYSELEDAITPDLEDIITLKNCEFETDVEGCLENMALAEAEAAQRPTAETQETKTQDISEATTDAEEEITKDEIIEKLAESPTEEITELSDDDFVDEMFEFTDDFEDDELLDISDISRHDQPDESEDLLVDFADELSEEAKPVKKSAPKSMPKVKAPQIIPAQPFTEKLHLIPELTDAETDEHEIMMALNEEDADLTSEPSLAVRPPVPVNLGEQEAARMALSDAIAEIRKLSAEDYDVGFSELEQAIKQAEKILAKPAADLTAIRDAAAALLDAFDQLEERDESSLSDAELDELFYQSAVLEEMARPQKKTTASKPKLTPSSDSAIVQTELTKTASGAKILHAINTPTLPEPDFTVLSDTLTTISGINLSLYTEASQAALLTELDRAQAVLTNLQSTQEEIDMVAANLLGQMSKLQIQPKKHATHIAAVKTNAPAPTVTAILPATMIDELAPASTWSIGVTMIDEMEPLVISASTREKMLRAMRPHFLTFVDMISKPFRKLGRSLAVGLRTGLRAYRETLRA